MAKINLGIIGGGQLGSMLSMAAKKIGLNTIIFSNDEDAPAKNFCDEFIIGKYNSISKIEEFAKKTDLVTYEFENIPYETLKIINKIKKVLPNPEINKIIQNRLTEKDFLNSCNLRTANYVAINNYKDLKSNNNLLPGILKTCFLGYDGKGQIRINTEKNLDDIKLKEDQKYILEKIVPIEKEISIIITRYGQNKFEIYEPIENLHEDQILKYSKIPAKINDQIYNKSIEWAKIISEELNYIGTLCVEYFVDKNDNLFVNEVAPRVHNSGHLTINTHNISQFESHVRAVCGLEKIQIKKNYNGKMINLLGEEISFYRNRKFNSNEFFFDYLKKEIKPKRKMGHITILEK